MILAVRARISGRVQKVWFRGWTIQQAQALGLTGWVRNRADGSVEALFCGADGKVEAMLAACWDGPPAALVTAVVREPAEDPGLKDFRPLPTA